MRAGDTIVALASAPGRSARAVVRVSGPATREVLAAVLADGARPFERGCFRSRMRLGGRELPVLLATYRGPASYTGEDSAELLVPGNPHVVERVLGEMTGLPGVRGATPGEFTARAFLNDKMTLDRAEGVAATVAAESREQLAAARDLLEGRTGERYRRWTDELATLLALVEAGIDFTDQEDVVAIAPAELRARLGGLEGEMASFLGAQEGEEVAAAAPRVVLAGAPNAGKSTLFNALLGMRRAVVAPVAGTTRDALEEPLDLTHDLPGAGPVVLVDLAGLEEPGRGGAIEGAAQAGAREAVARADVVVHCDPAGRFGGTVEDRGGGGRVVIRVRTKADLVNPGTADRDAIPVCALDGFNLAVLRRAIADASSARGARGIAALLPRHRRALGEAVAGVRAARAVAGGDRSLADAELTASALRGALDALEELAGRITPDDIIGRIFATFCVGK